MELSLIGKNKHRRERELAEIRAKGIAEGREQGAAAERKRWQQWNEARMRAADEGREFDELPPGDEPMGSGHTIDEAIGPRPPVPSLSSEVGASSWNTAVSAQPT